MKVKIEKGYCIVTKEKGDKIPSGVVRAKGESLLLYQIKKILNAKGYNLIKKRMCKDGHLVDDLQQYLRTRKPSGNPKKDVYIWNGMWAIKGAEAYLREEGVVTLSMMTDVFNKKGK